MSSLTAAQQEAIECIASSGRSRFDLRERRVYSHDTGVLPKVARLFNRSTLADGVVKPASEDELVELVRYAYEQRIAIVPRGKATSGYGGAVPARGGLVIDLSSLKGLLRMDATSVTVAAGTIWTDLEAALAEHGLALRLYPTSAPASTVGGWLAQGGAGIGSHAYGWFAQNVLGARLVTGTGALRALEGDDLCGIADAEGTTGIVTEVTLAVRPLSDQLQTAIGWPDAESLGRALELISERKLPIWSVGFIDPSMAELKNAARALSNTDSADLETTDPVQLPSGQYITLCVYDASDADIVLGGLREIALELNGQRLPSRLARHEWAERFRPMRLKRLGPSLVPFEVVVPLANLAPVITRLARTIKAPLAIEGLSVRGDEVVLLGFVPHDERRVSYAAGYGFVLSAIRTAERHGGRAYSTGRYFGASGRAERILGRERIDALSAARTAHDPAGILNPGKVIFDTGPLSTLIGAASSMEPIVRRAANLLGRPRPPAERLAPKKHFTSDVASFAYACAQCGYCVDICPQYQDEGWESSGPRGKWSFLKDVLEGHDRFDNDMLDTFERCTACGKCDAACQIELPILTSWGSLRRTLWEGMLTRTS